MVIGLSVAANLSFWPLVKCHLKEPSSNVVAENIDLEDWF